MGLNGIYQKGVTYDPDDAARTIKETNIHDRTGNMESNQGQPMILMILRELLLKKLIFMIG